MGEDLAVAHLDRSTPSDAQITALAPHGTTLMDTRPRMVPPRSKGVPDDVVDPAEAAGEIRAALGGKTLVVRSNADFAGDGPPPEEECGPSVLRPAVIAPETAKTTAQTSRPRFATTIEDSCPAA
ncbi:hypothetical protein [Streptomyces sp. NPDC002164]|uniref:hypothetical protein n=1 Tax=Streptomyces sp. NPDC002164 TaxID=3364633 RepID=UPI00369AC469